MEGGEVRKETCPTAPVRSGCESLRACEYSLLANSFQPVATLSAMDAIGGERGRAAACAWQVERARNRLPPSRLRGCIRSGCARRRPANDGEGWQSPACKEDSCLDINRGRGKAVRILGRLLQLLAGRLPLAVAEMQGGSKRNATPRE